MRRALRDTALVTALALLYHRTEQVTPILPTNTGL